MSNDNCLNARLSWTGNGWKDRQYQHHATRQDQCWWYVSPLSNCSGASYCAASQYGLYLRMGVRCLKVHPPNLLTLNCIKPELHCAAMLCCGHVALSVYSYSGSIKDHSLPWARQPGTQNQ